MGNQWREARWGEMWSILETLRTRRAALFSTICSLFRRYRGHPKRTSTEMFDRQEHAHAIQFHLFSRDLITKQICIALSTPTQHNPEPDHSWPSHVKNFWSMTQGCFIFHIKYKKINLPWKRLKVTGDTMTLWCRFCAGIASAQQPNYAHTTWSEHSIRPSRQTPH